MLRDLIVYLLTHTFSMIALTLLGEVRVDAYISISILVYFISTMILPSFREYSDLRFLDVILFIVFSFIVAVRVLDVLGYKLPMVFI